MEQGKQKKKKGPKSKQKITPQTAKSLYQPMVPNAGSTRTKVLLHYYYFFQCLRYTSIGLRAVSEEKKNSCCILFFSLSALRLI
jgi:hypothetical protein